MRDANETKTVTIHIPFQIRKRGGRKEMVLPPGGQVQRPRIDNTVVKALARAFRWKRLLEQGAYSSVTELAEKENIGMSFLTRVLRMTLLAPDIIDAILDGRQSQGINLTTLAEPFPVEWASQRRHFSMES